MLSSPETEKGSAAFARCRGTRGSVPGILSTFQCQTVSGTQVRQQRLFREAACVRGQPKRGRNEDVKVQQVE